MKIKYFGYDIDYGDYFLHSQFKSVHNYTDNKVIVSIVNRKIGRGPNNIVVDNFPLYAEKQLIFDSKNLILGKKAYTICENDYEEDNKIYLRNKAQLKSVLTILLDNINFEKKSLGFILFKEEEKYFQSSFEKAFVKKVKNSLKDFSFDILPNIAQKMKGLGFGLTPSGDDFNCGVLYALHYLKDISKIDLTEIIYKYYVNTKGNNLISNTFILQAYKNNYYENLHNLLIALENEKIAEIIYYRDKIIASGHSSGSDMLTGFIFCLNSFYEGDYQGGLND